MIALDRDRMFMRTLQSLACLGMWVLLTSAARVPRTAVMPRGVANTFFGCESGFAFETSGEAARCRRSASVEVAPMIDCPQSSGVLLTERVDVVGAKDMCGNTSAGADVSVERTCPPSYTKRVLPGRDRCELPTPEMIRAPSIPVAR